MAEEFKIPVPTPSDNVARLFENLQLVKAYVLGNYEWALSEARKLNVVSPLMDLSKDPYVSAATLEKYQKSSVLDQYIAWDLLKQACALHSRVHQNYKTEWDTPRAIVLRLCVYSRFHYLLENAFLPQELREARAESAKKKAHENGSGLNPFNQELKSDLEEDLDQLFNSDDELL
jgi:hypothetical protein